ncbi:MAG: chromosomal replication initiator protein DnaA [Phycisphaerales bacterium]|nr:chromosomal replication initiator protein DnaA [Phycisphaerales bacterium]
MNAHGLRSGRSIAPTKPVRVDPDLQTWLDLLSYMRATQPGICRQWFEEIEPLGITGGVLYLRAHTNIHRDYLQRQCLQPFNDAAQTASGRLISVRFLGPEDELPTQQSPSAPTPSPSVANAPSSAPIIGQTAPDAPHAASNAHTSPAIVTRPTGVPIPSSGASTSPATSDDPDAPSNTPFSPEERMNLPAPGAVVSIDHHRPLAGTNTLSGNRADLEPLSAAHYDDGLVLNPDYGFDNFIVGPSNRLAHAAAIAVGANPGRAYNPYFVHGGVGLGKTHLLQAMCLNIRAQRPDAIIYYTSCEGFMTQFMDAVGQGMMTRFRHKFRHVDVLVIDDIHFLAKRDRTQEEFFHTFNSLYQSHKQIILSSDAAPEDIPDLEDRLVSRFKWGLVAQLTPPCYETRVEILKNKSRIRGLTLPDDVACYLGSKIDTNIRELEGAIVKLQVFCSVESRPLSLEAARACFNDADVGRAEPKIQIQTIIDAVTDYFGVKVTDLQSKRRQRSIAQPRQLCMYLARKHTRYSLEEIGGYFGGRDHTTVMHAVRTIDDRRETDAEFNVVVSSLEDRLRTPG